MTDEASKFTSTDPAEILSSAPHRPTREQTVKTVQDKWPGHITLASDRASFSGCRIVTFAPSGAYGLTDEDVAVFAQERAKTVCHNAEAMMNLYFSTRANLLMLDWKLGPEVDTITVVITTQLDAEDLEEMQEVNVRVNLEMREWREKRAKEKAERQAEALEERRLIEVGRTAETYNLAGRVRELEAELSEARKAARAP